MQTDVLTRIGALLASADPKEMQQGLALARQEIASSGTQARPLFDMLASIFYIDVLDRPDLASVVSDALDVVAGLGHEVVPALVEGLDAGDFKAQLACAQALGRIGDEVVGPLLLAFQATPDAARRSFILYALGKVASPRVADALPLALDAARSDERELRDTATRALGKFAQAIPAGSLSEPLRARTVAALRENLQDASPVLRAKALRSLGKLAAAGHLAADERGDLEGTCQRLLGADERWEWDRAFVVRKEAAEALRALRQPTPRR
jgi:PBS lyase HEAT-like repeat